MEHKQPTGPFSLQKVLVYAPALALPNLNKPYTPRKGKLPWNIRTKEWTRF
jgi:hypothetical protein